MKANRRTRPVRPPFGHPDAIRAETVAALPPQMQREAVLLLFEMGLSHGEVEARTGFSGRGVSRLLRSATAPFSLADQWFEKIGGRE